MAYSTVTTLQPRVTGPALAAALFYCHPDATALTLVHILTSQPVPNVVILAAIAALRGYRIQDKARATELMKVLRDVLDSRKDSLYFPDEANAVTCPEN